MGMEQSGEKILGAARSLFREEGISVETELLKANDLAETILEYSENSFDLVFLGVHGENEKQPYTLGSVTKKVIMHASRPTLIVKKTSSLTRILVCLDGSTHSSKALEYAVRFAEIVGSKLALLNVQEHHLHRASPEATQELSERIFSKTLSAIGSEKINVEKRFEVGVPSEKIVETVEQGNYDLVVLGRRGLNPVTRFLLGSVSDDISQKAKCSVLLVP
jgi:nucleotide-binding universal stress UspA family protein